ncbi:hypothetical protein, partial [Vibrio cholerae]|uniref:hypothetical protein n=1 Tax=Vibrio cholerae TaxID=666 RepID=UPI001C1189D9
MHTASVYLLEWPQQCNDLQKERHRSRALGADRLAFNAYSNKYLNVRAWHWRPIGQVWIAAGCFDLGLACTGNLLAFSLLGLHGT